MKRNSFALVRTGALVVLSFAAASGCTASDVHPVAAPGAPDVAVAYAQSSLPFRDLPQIQAEEASDAEHAPLRPFAGRGVSPGKPAALRDPVVQSALPIVSMPGALLNFSGQADSSGVRPADTNGAVGPSHYVQTVNLNTEIWNKNGTVALASRATRLLWSAYTCTNAGCACSTRNDGDPVVIYDQLADRWVITQFSLPNESTAGGPSFQCVAVSKTGDPTGAYWLYDFKYSYGINDYGKFGMWPDGYYATFNMFDAAGTSFNFKGADFCVYDRVKMLAGQTATQQCFLQTFPANYVTCPTDGSTPPVEPFAVAGALPVSLDGKIAPPLGAPGWFAQFDYSQCAPPYNQLDLWSLAVDWTTPSNSKLTGPTVVSVANFTPICYFDSSTGDCVPEPKSGLLAGLDDRLMFRFSYRNFGSLESLLINHSVAAAQTSTAVTQGGVRWYELHLPGGAPTLAQQGTYAPSDSKWRWMASIAQDQAQDIGLGYSISIASSNPAIGWTGRLPGDAAGTMAQGEAVVDTGAGAETGGGRWGDYSNMTIDPSDGCTFWYTQMLYGASDWQTYIADFKFTTCGANDFNLAVAPATQNLARGASVNYTVSTTSTKGVAETIALYVQDLPSGVTATFNPASVTTGGSSTLTLTATLAATLGSATFTVIGKAASAVHAATAQVNVVTCAPLTTCPTPDNCGTIPDGCGGTVSCGTCTSPQTCAGGGVANVCGCTPTTTSCPPGTNCGTVPNGCGGTVSCGPACTPPQSCGGGGMANVCGCTPTVTSCPAGSNCGTIPNGCGGVVVCGGACTSPQSCGGGGVANQCGCTPTTMCPAGSNCGTVPDGCGGTVTCGPACTSPQSCGGGGVANQCGCTPTTTMCPAGSNCGTVPNGCGGTVSCGPACTSPQSCGGGGVANQCGCTATTCAAQSAECGTIPDGCGATLTCPTCSGGKVCVANKCVAVPPDLAMSPPADLATGASDLALSSDDLALGGDDLAVAGPAPDLATGGGAHGGCGCRVGGERAPTSPAASLAVVVLLGAGLLRRRARLSRS